MQKEFTSDSVNDNEIIVERLNDFLESIYEMRKAVKSEEGEDPDPQHFFFRGQANVAWDIAPGIFRGSLLSSEAELIRSAYMRNPSDFCTLNSSFECLTKLQHYGLPTRLLDVTSNPMVALYFACQPHNEIATNDGEDEKEFFVPTDGAVFYKRTYRKGFNEPEIAVLAHLANIDTHGDLTLDKLLSELQDNRIYTAAAAAECRKMKYRSLIDILQQNFFVISNLNNERLIRQSGAFLIVGQYNLNITKEAIGESVVQKAISGLRSEFEEVYFKIPYEKKAKILDELDFYNINEGSLFPELEHQMTYIKSVQQGKARQAIGLFSKVAPEDTSPIIDHTHPVKELSDDQAADIFQQVLGVEVESNYYEQCLASLKANLAIDWYRRETVISQMRIALAKELEHTSIYNLGSAKEKSKTVMQKVLSKVNEVIGT